jgi:hypothetical protein
VTDWLLAGDPAIRWQTLRDLTDAPPQDVAEERSAVAERGWGRRLIDLHSDGGWAGGACFPGPQWRAPSPPVGDPEGQPWVATLPTLRLLRAFGIDPGHPDVAAVVREVAARCRWEYAGEAFFDGEVEPCINGGATALGAYFGQPVDRIVARLLGEQLGDGGWNCEAENGSTRSSFHTTMCVIDGLWEYERRGGSIDVTAARQAAEEYLLARGLFRRASTGQIAAEEFLHFSFPTQWHYDILRALDYFRDVGDPPDPRVAEAVDRVRTARRPDGRWLLENTHPGLVHFHMEDGDGAPSRWNTLRALRVLRWFGGGRND